MTEVLQSSPSHFSSPSSSVSSPCGHNDAPLPQNLINTPLISVENGTISQEEIDDDPVGQKEEEGGEEEEEKREREGDQLSLLALLVTAFRKSLVGCSLFGGKDLCSMEIGVPTNVRHVAHVTFDRFNGFLGLPVEFEPEVSRRAPSARSIS